MAQFIQPSFSSGELDPSAHGRVDLAKFLTGLKTCLNFITKVHGGVVNRAGTEFIAEVQDSSISGRFIPFIFNATQSYALHFQNLIMQVLKDGGVVLEGTKAITATTNATPIVITSNGHGYANGNKVFTTGTGIPYIDGRFWYVANQAANTFELSGSVAPGSTSATGTVARVFTLATPYTTAMLPYLTYAQLKDVLTLAINDIRPKDLKRADHASWSIADMPFQEGPFLDENLNTTISVTPSNAGGSITLTASSAIFSAANVGQLFYLAQQNGGVPWAPGQAVAVGDFRKSDGRYYQATSAGTTGATRPTGISVDDTESDGVVTWAYRHPGFGTALITGYVSDTVVNASVATRMPDESVISGSNKWAFGAWGGNQGWPAAVTYFQQRRVFASSIAQPEAIWLSGTNSFSFFGKSQPIQDDDAITIQLVSSQVNAVRHMLQLGKLIVLTVGGKWVIPDDDNNVTLTPQHKSARQQGSIGASIVPPALIEESVLYVAEKGHTVQDLAYQFASNAFAGKDIAVLSRHLFENHTIVASAYQHVPNQIYWLVRDDGVLITCTYLREHEVWGWHRQITDGFFEDVCVVPEAMEDKVYFRVRRTINGVTKRYWERLAPRQFSDIRDAWFVDSGLKYDGINHSGITLEITDEVLGVLGDGTQVVADTGTLTVLASAPFFNSLMVGSSIVWYDDTGKAWRYVISAVADTTHATINIANLMVPLWVATTVSASWALARITLTNFHHLEGKTLSVLVDGHVHPPVTVVNGTITLQYPGVTIIAGLPYNSDLETLNLNAPAQGSILDREKCMFAVRLMVHESRGIFAGPDADHLDEYAQRENEDYDEPVRLHTGLVSIRVDSTWEPGGRVFIRQSDPLPIEILGVMPDVDIGGAR